MIRLSEIKLTLAEAEQPEATLHAAARRLLGLDATEIAQVAQLHHPGYSVGELVSLVVEEAASLPQMR